MRIYKKIFAIQIEIEKLIKDELNKFQRYQYFNEYQVLTKLRPLLEKHKLSILMSDENHILEYSKGEKEYLVKYLKKIRLVDVESADSESVDFNFWAIGGNTDLAKAKGSAETYAVKYFLSKFFLIPVIDRLDPDTN